MLISRFRETFDNFLLYLGGHVRGHRLLRLVSMSPHYAVIRVTENCNSRCITCNAWRNKHVDELTTEEIKNVLRQLRNLGVNTVRLTGGEPLLRPDIGGIVEECHLLGFREIYIGTNGLLLKVKAKELIEKGVTHFGVSIDGLEETNYIIRGIPSGYKRSVEGIETVNRLKKEKNSQLPAVSVFTTFLKQNIEEMQQLVEMCRKLGVRWCFNLLDANIHFFKGINASKLSVDDEKKIDRTIDYLKKTRRESPKLIYCCEHALEYARSYLKGNTDNIPCIIGYKVILIRSHGEVYSGCPILGPIGNLRERKLRDILTSKKYRKCAEKMYRRDCPGCTFFCADNAMMNHLISHRLRCQIIGF